MPGTNIPQRKGPSGPVNTNSGSGGITPPAGQIDGTTVDPLIVGITDSTGAELTIGQIDDGQVPIRSGLSLTGLTPISGPVNPTDDGKVAVASAGDFTYLGGSSANQLLEWDGTSWQASSDIEVSSLTFTPAVGSAANTGAMRIGDAWNLVGWNGAANRELMLYTAASGLFNIGSTGATAVRVQGTSSVQLNINGTTRLVQGAASLIGFMAEIGFDNSVSLPVIDQQTTANATGQLFTINAQNSTTGTGGAINIASGTGPTAAGELSLSTGTTKRFRSNDTGLAFFNVAPIAQRTLTDNTTGTPATTLVDVGAAYSQANINNNFASLRQLINAYGLCA